MDDFSLTEWFGFMLPGGKLWEDVLKSFLVVLLSGTKKDLWSPIWTDLSYSMGGAG